MKSIGKTTPIPTRHSSVSANLFTPRDSIGRPTLFDSASNNSRDEQARRDPRTQLMPTIVDRIHEIE
jgi:hypothetical protein